MGQKDEIKKALLPRLDALIAEGKAVHDKIQTQLRFDNPRRPNLPTGGGRDYMLDTTPFYTWIARCKTTIVDIATLVPAHRSAPDLMSKMSISRSSVERLIGYLQAFKEDIDLIADSFISRLSNTLSSDYMGQAEALLGEGASGKNHVPAAVLAGAVLERNLRTLCERHVPPIPLVGKNDKPRTMEPLINDLSSAGIINSTVARNLKSWAGIRNDAAHGDWDKFTRGDVERMIEGVREFLVTHL